MDPTHIFDVCIVGSGASGAICALELARHNLSVVVIEQGTHAAAGSLLDQAIPVGEAAFARTPTGRWVPEGVPWTACAVGGGTRFYGGVSFRCRTVDFDATRFVAPDALDPTWPFTYDTLRPYYDQLERLLPIARTSGLDPTEPPSPAPLMPAHPYTRSAELLAVAGDKLGLRPFPTPLAVNSVSGPHGSAACGELGPCSGRSCPIGAKSDVFERVLAPLLREGRIVLMPNAKAVRLRDSASGLVGPLEVLDLERHRRTTVRARTYIVAANAVQTAALLLRSASRHSPRGLGNSTDMVGRGLCLRACQYVSGELDDGASSDGGGRYSAVSFTDRYVDDSCPTGMGGLILEANQSAHQVTGARTPMLRLECLAADQPRWRNQVRLGNGSDRLGLPHIILDYRIHQVDLRRLDHLRQQAEQLLVTAGVARPRTEPIDFTLGRAHLHGTCRFGTNPRDSVCAPNGRVHDRNNLYVADGSLMPYPGGVNPTFTIQANALRIANGIARDLV